VKSGAIRLAVDAGNLTCDRRGMGRLVRGMIRAALEDPSFEVTLLAERASEARALRKEFPGERIGRAYEARLKNRFEVVWYPFNGMRYGAAAPAAVTMHDVFAFTEPHRERVARRREQEPVRRAGREAARIVTGSLWARAEIAQALHIDEARITVVRPEPDRFWFPALNDPLPEPLAGTHFVLVVGAREPRKNVRLALAACAHALRGPREVLVIVGQLEKRDRAYARELRVRAGEIEASDRVLRALYRNAELVLVPSLAEGFGLVAIEAMACGAPVIASDASAIPEATCEAALLLDPRDPARWAAAIRDLLDDEGKRSALRGRGAARFAFADRAKPAREMLTLLRELGRSGAP